MATHNILYFHNTCLKQKRKFLYIFPCKFFYVLSLKTDYFELGTRITRMYRDRAKSLAMWKSNSRSAFCPFMYFKYLRMYLCQLGTSHRQFTNVRWTIIGYEMHCVVLKLHFVALCHLLSACVWVYVCIFIM